MRAIEGDHVVVQKQETASDGEIVVATVEGETTLKRCRKRGNQATLETEEPTLSANRDSTRGSDHSGGCCWPPPQLPR